ncbi:MAG: sulfite exporter TauE/SafE family protein [bacterium]
MTLQFEDAFILLSVGFISGFINTLAGGGSLLTLPVLIFLGLPGTEANGTNRIGLLIQNIGAMAGFRKHNVFPLRVALMAAVPAIAGAIIGALLAVDIPDRQFKPILVAIMIGVMIVIIIDPSRRMKALQGPMSLRRKLALTLGFFVVGIYGGFIQAGIGFFIITLMLSAGYELVRTNAVKIMVVFFFNIIALFIFIDNGQVNYVYGFVLGIGSAAGGWTATHVAVKKGHTWIRGFVVVMVIIFAAKLVVDSLG